VAAASERLPRAAARGAEDARQLGTASSHLTVHQGAPPALARGHGAVSLGLRWLFLRGDKGIAVAGIERGDVHLLRPMPRFPAEHLSNKMCDRGGAGLTGLAGVKAGQHRRGGAGLPIQEEHPGGGRQMGGIPVQTSADVVCHDDLLTRSAAGRAACGRQQHHR